MAPFRPPRRAALPVALLAVLASVPAAPTVSGAEQPEAAAAEGQVVDGIAAQVGTDVVLVSDVTRLSEPIEAKMREAGANDTDLALMRADVLERLIDRKLIALFAKRAEIQVNDLEIDEAVAGIAQENQLTPEQLRASVEGQGLTWDAYRQRLGEEILQQKVVAGMVRSKVRVEDAEVREFYDQRFGDQPTSGEEVHLQHIAVAAQGDKPEAKRAACERVRSGLGRVRAGEDFLAVAREVSEGTPDLGFVHVSSLAPWMAEAVGGMRPGSVSGVLELPVGCAVLRLVERREVEPVSFEQAQERIRQSLFEQRFEQEFEAFLEKLRKQTYVERKGAFADAARIDASAGAGSRLQ
ncbi:MAG TPA: SurA N-terminal domain-containing protein [Myxococcota bacterium]|nr:SurA N-terminal domain-containing protein [Myxococcota bacterium]